MLYLTAKQIVLLFASSSPCLTLTAEERRSPGATHWTARPMGISRYGMSLYTGTRSAPPAGCVP